jgi:hypothetical protein
MDKATLDSLPASDDKEFWDGADIHTNIKPERFFDQKHVLIRVAGHQAQCTHCDWGFQLDPGDKIVDGHLIDRTGKKVL